MISTKKLFGSYVLEKVALKDIAPLAAEREEFPFDHNCRIPREWTPLALLQVRPYNHDTSILRFSLPQGSQKLNLPVGSFMLIKAPACERDGTDAIRPYTSVSDDDKLNADPSLETGCFDILVKRYEEWGKPENEKDNFLFTRTNHSYKPPGVTSNYIHRLKPGDVLEFSYTPQCVGRLRHPMEGVKTITMIAVGVGIAPMIHAMRTIFKERRRALIEALTQSIPADQLVIPIRVKLLYGAREVRDILLHEQIEEWSSEFGDVFSVTYCVGSRWTNVHMGAKTKNYLPPPPPVGFEKVAKHAETGWVNEDKIRRLAYPPSEDTVVVVCGLPGVYEHLCGPRTTAEVTSGSALSNLGYTESMVMKL